MDEAGASFLQLGAVRIDRAGAAEVDGTRRLVSVPRDKIIRIEPAYGSGAERPVVVSIIGLMLLGVSIAPIVMLLNAIRFGVAYPGKILAALAFAIPAIWLLDLALRPRWFLRIETSSGHRKLLFPRGIAREAVEAFVARVRTEFGY